MRLLLCWALIFAGTKAPAQQLTATEYEQANLERNLRWMLERERERGREKERRSRHVAVYADLGVWHPGVRSLVNSLERIEVYCVVIDKSQLTDAGLRVFSVLVLPGGFAPSQWVGAGESGLKAVRTS